ncbi:MAG: hypothetical protein F4Y82_02900 [Cenarchaeum sp. SB0665_bin_23]|nr:hypothetical protein [Cenarchaeum sp. SB0667_bin_13]MXY37926.1 hypothetical protein [Cenarchaeum sp. SB0664_bin_35]MXY61048.1 hypothetical protein [Cenarchaeum sp. SB0665_bin_23]MXZ92925.1 hypothetical protein [Cenarchaeum sp. SB0666_bin_15]MYB47445.1 hypothetical protein [Cenarchaeum sp. SB0662_bin_33]MYC79182.1 hypothetical protein [Cenarchaeum sp. SB0661_bin_35]MYD59239.1 hypothetical protein [Cenarchaeum sp. SB0678_bin_8]MYG33743.1 hypothetical protein [Cenarchaeum sp. SB0677_bin_16]
MSEDASLQYERMHLDKILAGINVQERGTRLDITTANNSIKSLTAIKNGESLSSIVALGGPVMAKASIQTDSTVLTAVGKGVIIEMDIETAINYLEKYLAEQNANLNKITSDQRTIINRMEAIDEYFARANMPKEPPPGN